MNDYERGKYLDAVTELYALYRHAMFPDLPECGSRAGLLADLLGTQLSEAVHLLSLLRGCLHLPGDVCEFGVAQGTTSALMANEILPTDKRLWLYDSFEGLPEPSAKDRLLDDIFGLGDIERYAGTMACPQSDVRGRLAGAGFPPERAVIVPGYLERTLQENGGANLPEAVCFAYLDMDFYEPTLLALRALHGRVARGGALMVDDYGFFSEGAKLAVHEFLAERPGDYLLEFPPPFAGKFCWLRRG